MDEQDKLAWLSARGCDVQKYVPEHMQPAICNYLIFGGHTGHFLTALLSNDLMEAFSRADDTNVANMKNWTMFLYNEAPTGSYGSPAVVKAWKERGGIRGILPEKFPDGTSKSPGAM